MKDYNKSWVGIPGFDNGLPEDFLTLQVFDNGLPEYFLPIISKKLSSNQSESHSSYFVQCLLRNSTSKMLLQHNIEIYKSQ